MEHSGELRKFAMSQSFDGKHAVVYLIMWSRNKNKFMIKNLKDHTRN